MDAKDRFVSLGYELRANTEYHLIYENNHAQIIFNQADKTIKKVSLGKEACAITLEEFAAIQEQLSALEWSI